MNKSHYKYFALSEQDINWGIHVMDCGSLFIPPGSTMSDSIHPSQYQLNWSKGRVLSEYQLIYLIKGNGIFESTTSGIINLEKGSLILLYPGIWHRYKPDEGQDWNTYWIGFNGEFIESIVPKLGFTKKNPVKFIGYQDHLSNSYIEMIKISQIEFTGYQQVLAGEVLKLFGWIHAISKKSEFKEKNIDTLIQSAKLLLIQYDSEKGIESVADELNIGYSKFRKIFKDYTGMSPGQFKIQHKIKKAMELLMDDEIPIKEIVEKLQFESTQYFSKMFKKKTGMTPAGYRRRNG